MNLKQLFAYISLDFNYSTLKELYLNSNSKTRKKVLLYQIDVKLLAKKVVILFQLKFISLPNDMKTLDHTKTSTKERLKKWIQEYF